MYRPQYDYTFEEWRDHFAAASTRSVEQASFDLDWTQDYFDRLYPDAEESRYKRDRFVAALEFLGENWDAFNIGKIAIVSENQAAIGFSLMLALFSFYGKIPNERLLDTKPSVKLILEEAQYIEGEQGAAPDRH